jgi:hypothetical protein
MSCRIRTNLRAGSHYEKQSIGSNELENKMNSLMSERAKQDALLFPAFVDEPARATKPKHEPTYMSQMEPDDLQFVLIQGYSLDLRHPLTEWRERAVRFLGTGEPDWDHMHRVADTILFSLDVVQFQTVRDVEMDYWVPYRFRLGSYGNCVVRVLRPTVEARK